MSEIQKDKELFINLFSEFTGVEKEKLEEFLKSNDGVDVLVHSCNLAKNRKQQEKIEKIFKLNSLYQNLKTNELKYDLSTTNRVKDYLKNKYFGLQDKEYVTEIYLDKKHNIIETKVTEGAINSAIVDTRSIMKKALFCNARGIILAHNHPGGLSHPSNEDMAVTERLMKACAMVDVIFVDHFIVTKEKISSLREECLLDEIEYNMRNKAKEKKNRDER